MGKIKAVNTIFPEEMNIPDNDSCCPVWSGLISELSDNPA